MLCERKHIERNMQRIKPNYPNLHIYRLDGLTFVFEIYNQDFYRLIKHLPDAEYDMRVKNGEIEKYELLRNQQKKMK